MLTSLVILAGTALSAVVAWQIGGPQGAGVLAGFLCGVTVSGLCLARQRHLLRHRPAQVLRGVAEGFALKLGFVLLGALTFRYVDAAAARVDWRSFLVAFAAAVVVVAAVGTVHALGAAAVRRRALAAVPDRLEELEAL